MAACASEHPLPADHRSGCHPERARAAAGRSLIETCRLTYAYTDRAEPTLEDIDLRIDEADFLAIVGPNGAGKTTLTKHFVRLLEPTAGEVLIDGHPLREMRRSELAALVGYVFQNPDQQLFAETVADEVSFGPRQLGFDPRTLKSSIAEALAVVGLEGYETADPVRLTKGERQRVAVASALVARPRVLVLDEPTKGLDFPRQQRLMQLLVELNQRGHTIVMVTHSLNLVAEYASRVVLLDAGRVVLDAPTGQAFAREDVWDRAGCRLPPLLQLRNRLCLRGLTLSEISAELRYDAYRPVPA
jgi:energy-coupling factor transport system ATP-binding protein